MGNQVIRFVIAATRFLGFYRPVIKKIRVLKRGCELKENAFKFLGVLPVDSCEFFDTGKLEIL